MKPINVAIIEDDVMIHQSLMTSIEMHAGLKLAFDAFSVEEALVKMENSPKADVILQDIGLPGMNGIEGLPHILRINPNANIIMLTTYDENEKIFAALSNGACSYISKKTSLKIIIESIFTVAQGGSFMSPSIARKIANQFIKKADTIQAKGPDSLLTERQLEIVVNLSKGLSYKLIAHKLDISIDTVRSHIRKIYKLLQVNSKMEVVNMFHKGQL